MRGEDDRPSEESEVERRPQCKLVVYDRRGGLQSAAPATMTAGGSNGMTGSRKQPFAKPLESCHSTVRRFLHRLLLTFWVD